jgi:thiamine biosynthesis lipoprotein ApbE
MIDQLMSLYRPESELVALNAQAGAGQIEVSAATGKGWMIAALL